MRNSESLPTSTANSGSISVAIRQTAQPAAPASTRLLIVGKGGYFYVYRYNDATCREVILAVGRAASDPAHALTWKDAASLSRVALAGGSAAAGLDR